MKLSEKLFFSRRPTLLWCLFLFSFLIVYASSALCSEPPIINGKTRMSCSESQDLSIVNYQAGNTYTWSIQDDDGQKGTLSPTTGEHVTYTAPSSNPDCVNNPTIRVSCCGDQTDTITIAVNVSVAFFMVVLQFLQLWAWCTPGFMVLRELDSHVLCSFASVVLTRHTFHRPCSFRSVW